MANLTEVLERLKAEPEWKELDQPTRSAHLFNPTIRKHNATRARLLAVVEFAEAAYDACGWSDMQERYTFIKAQTAKLSAALEKQ